MGRFRMYPRLQLGLVSVALSSGLAASSPYPTPLYIEKPILADSGHRILVFGGGVFLISSSQAIPRLEFRHPRKRLLAPGEGGGAVGRG